MPWDEKYENVDKKGGADLEMEECRGKDRLFAPPPPLLPLVRSKER